MVDVVDAPFRIDRDDALFHRVERRHGTRPLPMNWGSPVSGSISRAVSNKDGFAATVDQGARQLDAGDFSVQSNELDFITLGRLARRSEPASQVVLYQFAILRPDEMLSGLPITSAALMPEQRQEARVGEQNVLAVNEYRFLYRLDQPLKKPFTILQSRAALLEIFQQFYSPRVVQVARAGRVFL